jgi:hypothetical protein
MNYERVTAAELVRDVFGSFEECVDQVLISTDLADSQLLIPHYGVGGLSPNSPDWLLFALLQDIAGRDARVPRATVLGSRFRALKAQWRSQNYNL